MSLVERPRSKSRPTGIGANRRLQWVDDFQVEEGGFGSPYAKEEEETLPLPVDSKDLFRGASSLANSDDLQVNFGRFLHHLRKNFVQRPQDIWGVPTEAKRSAPEEWKASSTAGVRESLAELLQLLSTPTSATSEVSQTKIASILKKALLAIESGKAVASETRTVLETFDGYVDSIDGDTAYVTLESRENGDVLYGEYSASELLARGICEQTRFLCETVKGGGGGRVHFAPLPKLKVSDEEARSIAREMREAFPGDDDSVIEY